MPCKNCNSFQILEMFCVVQHTVFATSQTAEDNSTSTNITADCDFLPECYIISCPGESLGTEGNTGRDSTSITINAKVNIDTGLRVGKLRHMII